MKAIIKGKRYDTEKATLIGEYDNIGAGADSVSDFGYWEAGLYVTPRSKVFFLAGTGGPMTRFARPAGKTAMQGGEAIIPLNGEEAFDWAQHHLDPDVVEKHFGDLIEDA
jgi:hypothetical protein